MTSRNLKTSICTCLFLLLHATAAGANEGSGSFGVLLMAHGGSEDWNQGVIEAIQPLQERFPVEIAFGMADAGSLEESVRALEARGVEQVGVVRMFISGESWYERTQQILGLLPGAPDKAAAMAKMEGHRSSHRMGFWRIESDLNFTLSETGLADAREMDDVLLTRMAALSEDPRHEVVAVVAHGPATDEEDARWIEKIGKRTALAASELGFNDVQVFTLREDWEEKRAGAEEKIRDFIAEADARGLTAIVVPYRVQGFGPYASVLEGLNYRADQKGLVPHEAVTAWIARQADQLRGGLKPVTSLSAN